MTSCYHCPMEKAAAFALVALGAVLGGVTADSAFKPKTPGKVKQKGLTGSAGAVAGAAIAAALVWKVDDCPPCPPSTTPTAGVPSIGRAGYAAAVGALAVAGGGGALAAAAKPKMAAGSKMPPWGVFAGALAAAAGAAALYPTRKDCAVCAPTSTTTTPDGSVQIGPPAVTLPTVPQLTVTKVQPRPAAEDYWAGPI